MRLFVAIQLNEEMKDALIDLQNQMNEEGVRGNYTPEENLHLTLAFIGEYPDSEEVLDAMQTLTFTSFPLTLNGFGNFGNLWWAGLENSPALQAVVRRLRRALAEHEIPFDKKSFRPHITLLRKANIAGGMLFIEAKNTMMFVDKISLMKSDRGKHGMIYTAVGSIEAD